MARTFSYADAVRLLGGTNSKVVESLDRLTGGALLGATIGVADVLGCFGVRAQFVELGRVLVAGVMTPSRRLSRYDRTQRIQAAHSIIVISAYFEAVDVADLPFSFSDLDLTKSEQLTLVANRSPKSTRAESLISELLDTAIPLPTPQNSHEVTTQALQSFYSGLSSRLILFVQGLAAWDGLAGPAQDEFVRVVRSVPGSAITWYERFLRDLAVEFTEVAYWANFQDHQATRHEVRQLRTALADLEDMLRAVSAGTVANERRVGLTRAYQADLSRPIIEPGDVPEGLQIPVLGDAYLDPLFRVADVSPGAAPSQESWWRDVSVRDDMNEFLAGYLTSPQATHTPLLILGQPGSGKSVLTRVLAARLPTSDFLVVRVVLRETQADIDLQDQIERAIRRTTGERLEWPTLARSAGDALPVVLLDGFDEMLQATGVSQTDYLMKVRAFQHRESDQGRPVAAVVTSRTTVADRARIPDDAVAVRLEPFDSTRVTAWLDMWRETNATYFTDRGLTAMPSRTALVYRELAEQPLLLLMLALYDADSNVLQDGAAKFSRADLYEHLLVRFASREVTKGRELHPTNMDRAVEEELRQLSVVAFSMFNRASQWVTEANLERDLTALPLSQWKKKESQDFRAPLGAAESVLGQFFFIQTSRAFQGDRQLQTYEFLHATFGEFLVARLIWQVLRGMVARESATEPTPLATNPLDDSMLFALLSFAPLSSQPSITSFLTELASQTTKDARDALAALLIRLFAKAWDGRNDGGNFEYEPRRLSVPARLSTYSANLMIMIVIAKGKARLSELFGGRDQVSPWQDSTTLWYQHVLLWRSQMSGTEFEGLVESLAVQHVEDTGTPDVLLWLDDGSFQTPKVDLGWIYHERTKGLHGAPLVFLSPEQHPDAIRKRAHFDLAKADAVVQHILEPLVATLRDSVNSFVRWPDDPLRSSAHLMMQVVFLPLDHARAEDAATAYRRCAEVVTLNALPWKDETRNRYCTLLLERLGIDEHASPALVDEIVTTLLHRRAVRPQLVRCILTALGRDPDHDRSLIAKLSSLVDADCATHEPAVALESWIRLVELDLLSLAEGLLSTTSALFRLLDPATVRTTRPELITRARWAIAYHNDKVDSSWTEIHQPWWPTQSG